MRNGEHLKLITFPSLGPAGRSLCAEAWLSGGDVHRRGSVGSQYLDNGSVRTEAGGDRGEGCDRDKGPRDDGE